MEIIHVFISHTLRYLIYLQLVVLKKLYGMINPHLVNIRIEAFTHGLIEYLTKISTVVTK